MKAIISNTSFIRLFGRQIDFQVPEGLPGTDRAGGWPGWASSGSQRFHLWIGLALSGPALRDRSPHPAGAAHSVVVQKEGISLRKRKWIQCPVAVHKSTFDNKQLICLMFRSIDYSINRKWIWNFDNVIKRKSRNSQILASYMIVNWILWVFGLFVWENKQFWRCRLGHWELVIGIFPNFLPLYWPINLLIKKTFQINR